MDQLIRPNSSKSDRTLSLPKSSLLSRAWRAITAKSAVRLRVRSVESTKRGFRAVERSAELPWKAWVVLVGMWGLAAVMCWALFLLLR